jgi:hypothetical protein
MATSPTQLSLKNLKDRGYRAAVVEKWNPHARIRQDLYGFIDLLGVGGNETIAVQSTSYSHVSERVTKIAEAEALPDVRKAGWKIEVHGWRKVKNRWEVRIVDVS